MIRRLVMFTNGIETLWYFSVKMGATFEKLGYEVFYFDQCKEYDSLSKLMAFAVPGITAAVSFNFEGCSGESYLTDAKGINFFEARNIPFINIVVDHPFYYHKFVPYLPKDYQQISIDREHERYLKKYFPEIKRGPFCHWQALPYGKKTHCHPGTSGLMMWFLPEIIRRRGILTK